MQSCSERIIPAAGKSSTRPIQNILQPMQVASPAIACASLRKPDSACLVKCTVLQKLGHNSQLGLVCSYNLATPEPDTGVPVELSSLSLA